MLRRTPSSVAGNIAVPGWLACVFFVLVVAVLAGCGGQEQGSSGEPADPGGSGDQTESQGGGQTESGTPSQDTGTPDLEDTSAEATSAEAGPVRVETSVVTTGLEAPWG